MRWAVVAAACVALAAVVAVNVLLLRSGGGAADPVGRLAPTVRVPAPAPHAFPTTPRRPAEDD